MAIGERDVLHEVRYLFKPYCVLLQKFLDFCKKSFSHETIFHFSDPKLVGSDENHVDFPSFFLGEAFDFLLENVPSPLAERFVHCVARAAEDDVIVLVPGWIFILQRVAPCLIDFDCQDPVPGLLLDDDLIDVTHQRVRDDEHAERPLDVGRWR